MVKDRDGREWSDDEIAAAAFPDGAALLDAVHEFIGRFVAFPSEHAHVAVTLWVAHAHMVEHFHTSPRLAPISPEPESGKTRLLEVIGLLVPAPMLVFGASVAAIFRTLADEQITLLFDEVDAIFTKRGKDDVNEDLRALLNVGYKRGATIPRCVGPRHEVVRFNVFAAVALAGIGDLPDTIMTRAIIIRMRRRAPAEPVEQFRVRVQEPIGHALRDQLADWAAEVGYDVGAAWPIMPEGITDRPAECWEPLLAVADAAGGQWPSRARAACVAHVADSRGRVPSLGIRLLTDLRTVFAAETAMSTEDILSALCKLDESPWGDLRGQQLNPRGLAQRLRQYGVSSRNVRTNERVVKGYAREDLHDVWLRYLSPPVEAATSATSATDGDLALWAEFESAGPTGPPGRCMLCNRPSLHGVCADCQDHHDREDREP